MSFGCTDMPVKKKKELSRKAKCCPTKPPLREQQLISHEQTDQLTSVFKVLANHTRLRLLHALVRADEMCVTDLADSLEMKPQAVSNQLQRLADQGILGFRRSGLQIFYRIIDPCTVSVLDYAWCLMKCSSTNVWGQDEKGRAAR